jgi:hypothetical protein
LVYTGSVLFTWSKAARAVGEALAEVSGPIGVLERPELLRALSEEQAAAVVAMAPKARSLKKLRGRAARGEPASLPVADGGLGALVGVGAGTSGDWQALLGEWTRAIRDGGALVLVDAAPRTELSRRALVAGLADIQQRVAGRLVVTSGRVRKP